MKQIYICSGCSQTCYQGVLKHIAGSSGIFSDYNLCFVFPAIVPAKETTYFVGMLNGQIYVCFSTKAVNRFRSRQLNSV